MMIRLLVKPIHLVIGVKIHGDLGVKKNLVGITGTKIPATILTMLQTPRLLI